MPKHLYVLSVVMLTPSGDKFANYLWSVVSDESIDALKMQSIRAAMKANPGLRVVGEPGVLEIWKSQAQALLLENKAPFVVYDGGKSD